MTSGTHSSVAGANTRPLSPAQPAQPGAVMEVPERPLVAPGVQFLGEMQGSGFQDRQWLVLRDGRYIQLTELLYRVAEQLNGEHTLEEVAARVTEATNWIVSADQVRRLIQTKLIPLRLVATAQGQPQVAAGSVGHVRGPLGVNVRGKVIGPSIIDPITAVLQVLYRPPILIPVLLAIGAAHAWLYVVHGVSGSIYTALQTPGLLLAALAIMAVSGLFHEFGHASALRYGGGKARAIGVGFYLMYPAFYTDTTDSYRLGRWARVRTDLGGFYFHLIFALGIMALYALWRQEYLLLIVVLIDLSIVDQCLPFVRFDGYWALADLTGLPDFFALMGPFVRSVWPWGRGKGSAHRLPHLKPWVKAVFALYIVITIPLLLVLLVLIITNLPHMAAILWDAFLKQAAGFRHAQNVGDYPAMAMSLAMMLLLLLQAAGFAALLYTLGRGPAWKLIRALWNWCKPSPMRRLGGGLVTAGAIALVAVLWAPYLSNGQVRRPPPVDGVPCFGTEMLDYHVHAALTLYENGRRVLLPANIGIPVSRATTQNGQPSCLYWLHTHDFDHALGVIHIESPTKRTYTLGQFFDIWHYTALWNAQSGSGHSVDATFVEVLRHARPSAIHAYVNGKPVGSDYRGITLTAHKVITIEIGRPLKAPTTRITFPQGE